ncbi:2,3-bisphosphoglycerate-independent phosphoglycerate mutase [Blattabacterium cuenoti]|uniref:2,3-bisphosphoglycerate-independent phosphoglycerate mutase n=1 Tax=Blattabacterium cuenoti TaxID=1653831 RepID=UPI00163BEBBA|nr:2,3-bisphosphoglycerate-independent phosphoglycerate mutase [Blattabacterium cuenoti]
MKKIILIILDGWGIASEHDLNLSAIHHAHTPFFDFCYKNYLTSRLFASGKHVGLPEKQFGNSEVGHMSLGSGRKIIQNLKKINTAIQTGIFRKQIDILFEKIRKRRIHFIGLLSDGGVHSHINHLFYLLKMAYEKKMKNVFIHAFTDGRDTIQKSSISYIKKLIQTSQKYVGRLSTVIGRYYSMDRDLRWDRTEIAYNAMVYSNGVFTSNIFNAIEKSYEQGITDEFFRPFIIVDQHNHPIAKIENEDVVFCFNFRSDRSKQITELLTKSSKNSYKRRLNIHQYITMTCFNLKKNQKNIDSLFKKEILSDTIGGILESIGKNQIRIAETEKYPHVTYFFSGGRENPFEKETRILCPSPKVSTYDRKPEMSAFLITKKIIPELKRRNSDFICLNFANPDMVGHSGNINATIKACEFVDKCMKLCVEEAIRNSYSIIIVGDHGNADCMVNYDGTPHTSHTMSLVPFILIDESIKKNNFFLKDKAVLSDVAPTILELMNIPIPEIMNGKSIIKNYKTLIKL